MLRLRRHVRQLSWIALLAILGLAIAPTISRAMAADSDGPFQAEVCTPKGVKLVDAEGGSGDPAAPQAGGLHLDHCPLCGLAAGVSLLPAHEARGLGHATRGMAPGPFPHLPCCVFTWPRAQPRGPPAA
ncbi:MAG: DUF2946 domain-containing protein [Vitreoscilla sp.]|nr:DUF2946 domain-containing protein [Vitreoscilla sp.]